MDANANPPPSAATTTIPASAKAPLASTSCHSLGIVRAQPASHRDYSNHVRRVSERPLHGAEATLELGASGSGAGAIQPAMSNAAGVAS